jgi:hypothetical protein
VFGFFLHPNRFIDATMGPDGERATAALLNTVYLWGIHLSPTTEFAVYSPMFLSRALQSTSQALLGTHPHKVIQCIQAEVLLAQYFFRNARILEGKYHMSAAVSLVLSSGFHKIRSPEESSVFALSEVQPVIGVPSDSTGEGERINAFWTVLILNNCWTTADGSPSSMSDTTPGARIDAPWPLNIADYEQVILIQITRSC